jgi:3-oxoadipate CoA-transferase beta subunit
MNGWLSARARTGRHVASKIVERCAWPSSGVACVKRICTERCTLSCTPTPCTPTALQRIEAVPGLGLAALERLVGLPIRPAA